MGKVIHPPWCNLTSSRVVNMSPEHHAGNLPVLTCRAAWPPLLYDPLGCMGRVQLPLQPPCALHCAARHGPDQAPQQAPAGTPPWCPTEQRACCCSPPAPPLQRGCPRQERAPRRLYRWRPPAAACTAPGGAAPRAPAPGPQLQAERLDPRLPWQGQPPPWAARLPATCWSPAAARCSSRPAVPAGNIGTLQLVCDARVTEPHGGRTRARCYIDSMNSTSLVLTRFDLSTWLDSSAAPTPCMAADAPSNAAWPAPLLRPRPAATPVGLWLQVLRAGVAGTSSQPALRCPAHA